jgi:hypothetical protein
MAAAEVVHPLERELRGIYGTILAGPPQTPAGTQRNVCVFADREVDRSPTGTGTAGRVAQLVAHGALAIGDTIVNESIVGSAFRGRALERTTVGPYEAVVPEVAGRAAIMGWSTWVVDPEDELGAGFFLRWLATPAHAVSEATLRGLRVPAANAVIPIADILSGGPPPQGIPALGFRGLTGVAGPSPEPRFVSQAEAAAWLGGLEPVILVRVERRGAPLPAADPHLARDRQRHPRRRADRGELLPAVQQRARPRPARARSPRSRSRRCGSTVTPSAPAAAGRRRRGVRAADRPPAPESAVEVTFGVSGLLYFSNMLMFDDTTFTLWSQLIGEGMVGELAGEHLLRYPAQIVGFDEARAAEPDALVLSRETGFNRDYGRNPYVGYDEIGSPAFLFSGPGDGRLQPKARVITLEAPRPLAYDFDDLRDAVVVHDEVDGTPLLLLWAPAPRRPSARRASPPRRTSARSASSGPSSTAAG